MSNDLFKSVNYDEVLSTKEVLNVVPTPELTVDEINKAISAELQRISSGVSKLVPYAIQVREGATPFLNALKTFQVDPIMPQAMNMVLLARQDFGGLFGDFVENLVSPLYKGKK